jgi:hypothetical protein
VTVLLFGFAHCPDLCNRSVEYGGASRSARRAS